MTETIKIKRLSKENIPEVIEMSRRIFNVGTDCPYHQDKDWNNRYDNHGLLLGAYLNNLLVGYKYGYSISEDRFHSWMGGVLAEHRGKGIATMLLKEQESIVRDEGFKYITVNTFKELFPAMYNLLVKNNYELYETETMPNEEVKSKFKKFL